MTSKGIGVRLYVILLGVVLASSALPAAAQHSQMATTITVTAGRTIGFGQELEFNGRISRVDGDVIGVVDSEGVETAVLLVSETRIKGDGKHHSFLHLIPTGGSGASADRAALLVGLPVRVEGRGNCAGQLVAEVIKYRCCDPCACANTMAKVLGEQQRLADELAETTTLATAAAKDARSAQETADRALSTANKADSTANSAQALATNAQARINSIDDFEVTESLTVQFKVNSAVLSDEAKAKLDEFASKAASAKGYVIEIAGYASKEGTLPRNELLSARRADAVRNSCARNVSGNAMPTRVWISDSSAMPPFSLRLNLSPATMLARSCRA